MGFRGGLNDLAVEKAAALFGTALHHHQVIGGKDHRIQKSHERRDPFFIDAVQLNAVFLVDGVSRVHGVLRARSRKGTADQKKIPILFDQLRRGAPPKGRKSAQKGNGLQKIGLPLGVVAADHVHTGAPFHRGGAVISEIGEFQFP